MKDIMGSVGRLLSYLFAALVIGYTAALTYMVAGRLVPGNLWLQIMTVMLFDGAAMIWAITFVTQAKATSQWAFAAVGFAVGLIGAVIMAAGELILGQDLVVFNDPTKLGWILITCVITACVTHVVLIYLYHFSDPAVKNRIEIMQKVADKIEQGHIAARAKLERDSSPQISAIADSVMEIANQMLEREVGANVKERNRRAVDNSKISGAPPILAGIARDPIPDHRQVSPAPPAAHNNTWKKNNQKHQRPQQKPRPSNMPAPAFSGNGHGQSAEHAAFAATTVAPDAIKERERTNPPSRPDSPKS